VLALLATWSSARMLSGRSAAHKPNILLLSNVCSLHEEAHARGMGASGSRGYRLRMVQHHDAPGWLDGFPKQWATLKRESMARPALGVICRAKIARGVFLRDHRSADFASPQIWAASADT